MPSESVITATDVSKRYAFDVRHQWSMFGRRGGDSGAGGYQALHPLTFEVRRGESVGVIGRNGAGKSTLLQILTGTMSPTTGTVRVQGRTAALLELGAGFNPDFTGAENIFLTGALVGMSRAEVRKNFSSIVEFAEIGEFIDRPVKTYSSGMLVRLAFSTQIHVDPDVLIVDEALSVGDIFFQQKCISRIRALLEKGVTLFFVSHGLNAVKSLCSRALLLNKGHLVADGPADAVCDLYQNSMTDSGPEERRAALASDSLVNTDRTANITMALHDPLPADPQFGERLSQRSGSGDLRFTAFGVFNERDEPIVAMEQAGRVRIRARLHAEVDIDEGAAVGLLLRDANGVDLIAYNSNFYRQRLPALKRGTDCIWEVDLALPLARGFYSWHCGVKPNVAGPFFYDRCFGAGVLEVLGNPLSWGDYGGRIIDKPIDMRVVKLGEAR